MSDVHNTGTNRAIDAKPMRLRDALRKARIEAADRTGVVVDLRDAEVARLEILNDALDLQAQHVRLHLLPDRRRDHADRPAGRRRDRRDVEVKAVSRNPMLCCAGLRHAICFVVVVADTTAVSAPPPPRISRTWTPLATSGIVQRAPNAETRAGRVASAVELAAEAG